ncbi:hypothetical protein N7520_004736 [Penicillium odoratum]|uniref:uncharacterized protein n=1 Tax=Penicillium odoratum TaxID=1167516 RepID=UPI002547D3A4|nr:uncharacterized protein N7520_004736 [Penicillium odoratum]KAJ5765177.1 hypothetical protein N7520_004736 [Penicillium odoratum]
MMSSILKTVDLADNPPHQYIIPDDPELPLPLDTTVSNPRAPDARSTQLFSTTSQPPPGTTSFRTPNPRRRRLQQSSPDTLTTETAATSQLEGSRVGDVAAQDETTHQPGRTDGRPPSRKRRRLLTMRADGLSGTNGFSQASNGASSRKTNLNGQATASANGESHANGAGKAPASQTYYGHDREEVTRILIQSLYELGYSGSASALSAESGHQLETAGVATFRSAVLGGRWPEAERILIQSFQSSEAQNGQESASEETLLLAEEADRNEMLFLLRQQKFLELLDAGNYGAALGVLRQELTPLNYDIDRLHALSSLLMSPTQLLYEQAGWDGSTQASRERLLADLSKSISPSVMIPQHRLAILLDHVKQSQINNCLYHNTAQSPSLYSDHLCDRNDFPLEVGIDLTQHTDEVWYCGFSHDGTKLVTAGMDRMVLIYDTADFTVLRRLSDHGSGVAFASWSPDDTKLITCSQDKKARLWNVETGQCLITINNHSEPVTSAGWAPDGKSFVTSSFDPNTQLCHLSIDGTELHMWKGGFRVQDCAISPDGRRLVAADTDSKIHVFDFKTYEEDYCLSLSSKPTSIAISRDSKHMLVNLKEGEIQLIDLETAAVVRRFSGHKQGEFVIRSTFGGAGENFIVSGSDDSKVYIWHKENGSLVETLDGHSKGCVNSISWNPADPTMFASAGDDRAVRIWSRDHNRSRPTGGPSTRGVSTSGVPRMSAMRTTYSF